MTDSPVSTEDYSSLANVGQLLSCAAKRWPEHCAVAEPIGESWRQSSFRELEADANRIANGMVQSGLQPGQRIALLVPPGIEFVTLVFALFKCQAVIILIDPGIGRSNLVKCLSDASPEGMLGIPKAQIARWLFRKHFPKMRLNVVVGRRSWPGCLSIETFRASAPEQPPETGTDREAPAAIIFTSGSTGPPKGVGYSHGNFISQAVEIRDYFGIKPGGADVSGFPLFALFNTAMGKTTVFPKMDFTRPAAIQPGRFLKAVEDWQADQAFGSPALWNTVSQWCDRNSISLPSIKLALSAGAPVPAHVIKRVRETIAPSGEMYTPYGATEALPVACNSASIVLDETAAKTDRGKGVCVGSRFRRIEWKVIQITDGPINSIADATILKSGEIGELIVSGPVVTRRYETRMDANANAKIADNETLWHRMGDTGYFDEHRRFWFCGRKSQRVITESETLFTVPCESIVNTHPSIYRSALTGIGKKGNQTPVLVAEPWPEYWRSGRKAQARLISEIRELIAKHIMTRSIQHVMLMRNLPVDIRHNSKIFRERIAEKAARHFQS